MKNTSEHGNYAIEGGVLALILGCAMGDSFGLFRGPGLCLLILCGLGLGYLMKKEEDSNE